MGTSKSYYEKEVANLLNSIELAKSMTEEEIQMHFCTDDTKEDFMSFLNDELDNAESMLYEPDEDYACSIDEGFANEADYLRYKYA